jgi:hypothetical protein
MALRLKPVYRNKEDSLRIHGLGAGPIAVVFAATLITAATVGMREALLIGGLTLALLYVTLANRPPMWATYGILFFLRRRVALAAAAGASERTLRALQAARESYGA